MKIVRRHLRCEPVNGFIEIAMFGFEGRDSLLDGFDIEVHVARQYTKNGDFRDVRCGGRVLALLPGDLRPARTSRRPVWCCRTNMAATST